MDDLRFLREPSAVERQALIAAFHSELEMPSLELLYASGLVAIAAGYAVVEMTWPDEDEAEVARALKRHLKDEDPAISAGAAIRLATILTWWNPVKRRNRAESGDLAKYVVDVQSSWLYGWLLLCDYHTARGELHDTHEVALRMQQETPAKRAGPLDEFGEACESLITGRSEWSAQYAGELVQNARDAIRAARSSRLSRG